MTGRQKKQILKVWRIWLFYLIVEASAFECQYVHLLDSGMELASADRVDLLP